MSVIVDAVINSSASMTSPSPLNVCSLSSNVSVSDETIDDIYWYLSILLTLAAEHVFAVISIFGIIANVTNSLAFFRHGLKDRMTLCLFSLAVADQLFLLTFSYFNFLYIMAEGPPFGFGEEYLQISVSYGFGVHLAVRTTVGLYIMVIAVDRCLCVTFPLRASSLISTRNMAVILIFFTVLPQLGFVCQSLKYDVVKMEVAGITHWNLVPSPLYVANRFIMDIIAYAVSHISLPVATFFIASIATVMTVKQLTAAAAWRRKTSSTSIEHNSQQVALTKMLVLASCVYVATMVPSISHRAARLLVEGFSIFGVYYKLYKISSILSYGFPVINSSASFFIYYKHSSRYRKEISKVSLCSRCVPKQSYVIA